MNVISLCQLQGRVEKKSTEFQGSTCEYKIQMRAPVLFNLLSLGIGFEFPTDDSVCKSDQQCRLAEDCHQVFWDFKEKKIQPTVCKKGVLHLRFY